MKSTLSAIVVLSLSLVTAHSYAQVSAAPSAAQLEQFKKLPKSQQEALAKQMGFDLSILESMSDPEKSESGLKVRPEEQYLMQDKLEEEEQEPEDDSLKPFGYEMFESMQDAFLPEGNIPVPADYVIGSGDSLNISLYGKEYQEHSVEVNNDGKITLPNLEPITVAGLTLSELKEYINQVVAAKLFGMKAVVSVGELRSIQVYVLGDVKKPGAYQLSSLSSMANALFISGGPNEVGSLREIKLRRAGKDLALFDLYKFMLEGDVSGDQRLQHGDVIYVAPIRKQVTVVGEVRRPAIYEIKNDESLQKVLNYAGGLTSKGYPKSVEITSYNEKFLRSVQNVDLLNTAANDRIIKNGDVIRVHASDDRIDEAVNIAGYVSRPGTYNWNPGTKLNDIISDQSDLLLGADFEFGIIVRALDGLGKKIDIVYFEPASVISGKEVIELVKNDLVLFFNSFDRTSYYKEEAHIADALKARHELFELKNTEQVEDDNDYLVAFSELSQIYGDEKELAIEEEEKINYIYKILFGSETEKLEAFPETQSLSRAELIQPVIQLMEERVELGTNVKVVEVRGEVRFPGRYPIASDSKISDIIQAAGGFTESASLYRAEVSRLSPGNSEKLGTQHYSIDLAQVLQGKTQDDIRLSGRDVVHVFQKSNWNEELKVTLKGEVKYPGVYEIKDGESITDLITRAGGLTDKAHAESAFFTREDLKELEEQQAESMARALSRELALKSMSSTVNDLNVKDIQELVANLSQIEGVGRLIIDLPNILASNIEDVTLENGDMLIIPPRSNEINVIGEVQVATSHIYNRDWTAEDYINSSGGLKAQADDDRVYIIRANGLVDIPSLNSWFGTDRASYLNPGDTIVVPLDSGYVDKLTLWEKATAIFYQATVGIAAILRINN